MGSEIGDFLQSRRARIAPEDRGLPGTDRRRVPGLRREELAMLAGVSSDYYVRLEQGRAGSVSDAVLEAIARVLALDAAELAHLRALVRPQRDPKANSEQAVRPGLLALVESIRDVPVFVVGRRQQILATNPLGDAVLPDDLELFGRSAPRHVFLDSTARTYYADWSEVAAETVAFLRYESGRHPGDQLLANLVAELDLASPEFRELWSRHDVQSKTHGIKRLQHSTAGALTVGWETLVLPDDPEVFLITYAPHDESTSDALRILGSLQAQSRPRVKVWHPIL